MKAHAKLEALRAVEQRLDRDILSAKHAKIPSFAASLELQKSRIRNEIKRIETLMAAHA